MKAHCYITNPDESGELRKEGAERERVNPKRKKMVKDGGKRKTRAGL